MSNTFWRPSLLAAVLTLSLMVAYTPTVFASHIDWDAWRAERAAELQARRAARESEKTAAKEPTCTCSATLSLAKPSLSFGSSGLVFTPRVNVDVRLKGDQAGPKHTVSVHYEGTTTNSSDDITPPAGTNFSGDTTVLNNASCEGTWKFDGVELNRITLPGITRTLLSGKQELAGLVKMKTTIAGCGFAEEKRQFPFTVIGAGNLKIGSWRLSR